MIRVAIAFIAALAVAHCSRAAAAGPSVVIRGASAERGKLAMRQYGCAACHTIPGLDYARGLVGPPLVAWSRRGFIAGQLPNTPDNLVRWIRSPQSIEPGTAMLDLGVTDRDARDIAAYLYTIR